MCYGCHILPDMKALEELFIEMTRPRLISPCSVSEKVAFILSRWYFCQKLLSLKPSECSSAGHQLPEFGLPLLLMLTLESSHRQKCEADNPERSLWP